MRAGFGPRAGQEPWRDLAIRATRPLEKACHPAVEPEHTPEIESGKRREPGREDCHESHVKPGRAYPQRLCLAAP